MHRMQTRDRTPKVVTGTAQHKDMQTTSLIPAYLLHITALNSIITNLNWSLPSAADQHARPCSTPTEQLDKEITCSEAKPCLYFSCSAGLTSSATTCLPYFKSRLLNFPLNGKWHCQIKITGPVQPDMHCPCNIWSISFLSKWISAYQWVCHI